MRRDHITWLGPFAWPSFEEKTQLPSVPPVPGIYLLTFPFRDGFLLYAAGITRRSVLVRLREHKKKYWSGDYTILDVEHASRGERIEHWHGWGWTEEKRTEYLARQPELHDRAAQQLENFRVFVAGPLVEPRLLERIEAATMSAIYASEKPICDLADRGMHLSRRRSSEEPVELTNHSKVKLYGLPSTLVV